ncbi:MAG: MFS transporter [Patescibacteria group bacterium]
MRINAVVRTLVVTDFFYNSAFGSFAPIFAIFISGQIVGGSAAVAGFATAAFWITKSVLQLPIARFLDRTDGERDDFWAMFSGYLLSGLVPFAYLFATLPWHLYVIQACYGVFMALAVPGWYAIFTRHVDSGRIGFEWSMQSVFSVGVATALSAAVGGYVADRYGFSPLFLMAGILSFSASFLLLLLRPYLLPRDRKGVWLPERTPHR